MSAPTLVADPGRKSRAVRTTGGTSIEELIFDPVTVREPGPGEVLVAIKAASLNYRDLAVVTGRYPRNTAQPTMICSDGAGEVIAVGEGVTAFQTGDRVAGSFFQNWITGPYAREYGASALGGAIDGVLTQFRVFDQQGLLRVPEHLSFEEAATLPCAGLTAWNALAPSCHVQAGDTVLLLGTGGVSIFGLQFAKLHGARVIITSSQRRETGASQSAWRRRDHQLQNHPRVGQRSAAPHWRQGRRHRSRSGRRRNLPALHELRAGVRTNRRYRRAHGRGRHHTDRPDRSSDPKRARHFCRIGGHVRRHEPRYRRQSGEARCRSRLPVRTDPPTPCATCKARNISAKS